MSEEISVLISVYYRELPENLHRALDSVVNQTLSPLEVVLMKDGPLTPELDDIIDSFDKKYPNLFRIISLEVNQGLGEALRLGALNCNGDFIARMDSDDISRPDRFRKQMNYLTKYQEIDVIGCNIEEFNNEPGDLKRFKKNPESHQELIKRISMRSPFNHPSIIVRKDALLKAGNYNNDFLLFEDYSLFLRLWKTGARFYNIQEVLLDFRVGDGLETIRRRSGVHYVKKEIRFLKHAREIHAFSKFQTFKYAFLRLPIRLLPPTVVLRIYNLFLRDK
jgi:glycosyltransferase involved in cell wall biosynthesis